MIFKGQVVIEDIFFEDNVSYLCINKNIILKYLHVCKLRKIFLHNL